MLGRWGTRINLTADPRREIVLARQLPDAFQLAALLGEARGTALDAGAGAGLVAIPLALLMPELRFTLVEANQRKCAFLRAAAHELGLRLEVRAVRFETIEDRFALALSRATWSPEQWVEGGLKLLEDQGRIVVFTREAPVFPHLDRVGMREYAIDEGVPRSVSMWRRRSE